MGGAQESLEHAEHVEHAAGHNKQIALFAQALAAALDKRAPSIARPPSALC